MNNAARAILARFLGTMSSQIICFYAFFLTYSQTKSPYLMGLVGMALFVPTFLFGLKVGAWVDSLEHIGRSYLCTLCLGLFPILILMIAGSSYEVSIVVLALLSLIRTAKGSLYYSVLKNFPAPAGFVAKYNTLSWQVPLVLGSSIVSLFHTLKLDLKGVLTVALLFQLASIGLVIRYRSIVRHNWVKTQINLLSAFRDLDIFNRKQIFYPLFADTVLTGFMGLSAILPFLLSSRGEDGLDFGYYKSIFHLLSFLAVLCVPSRILGRSSPSHFVTVVFLWGLGVGTLAVSQGHVAIGVLMGALGALDGFSALIRENFIFSFASEGELGRISSLNNLLVSTGDELGEFNTGWMVGNLGVTPTLLLSSMVSLGVALQLNQSFKTKKRSWSVATNEQ